jgi:CBS domain-containing protein
MMAARRVSGRTIVQPEQTNIVVCPRCGEENIEGADSCQNCLADLAAIDVPDTSQVVSQSDLALPISQARLRKPTTVAPTATIREAIALLARESSGGLVVVERGAVVGVFTERDVLNKIAGRERFWDDPVSAHMTPDPVILRDHDTIAAALNKMGVGGFRHIPVVRDGRLIGLVTARDAMNWVMGRFFD